MKMIRCDFCGLVVAEDSIGDWNEIGKGNWARKLDICPSCYKPLQKKLDIQNKIVEAEEKK